MIPECGDTKIVEACWTGASTLLLNVVKFALSLLQLPYGKKKVSGVLGAFTAHKNQWICQLLIKACLPSIAEFQHSIGNPLLL